MLRGKINRISSKLMSWVCPNYDYINDYFQMPNWVCPNYVLIMSKLMIWVCSNYVLIMSRIKCSRVK